MEGRLRSLGSNGRGSCEEGNDGVGGMGRNGGNGGGGRGVRWRCICVCLSYACVV